MLKAALSRLAVLGVAALVAVAPASTQTFPKFTGFVVDAANTLSPETEAALTTKLDALQRETKRQLIVATVPDTAGRPIEDYGIRLLRTWQPGLKGVDNGAILFVAPGNPAGQRGPRLEVGRGLEPILTDAFSESVAETLMTPILKQTGDVDRAMTVGTDAVIDQLRASPEEAQAKVDAAVREFDRTHQRQTHGDDAGFPIAIVFFGILFLFFVLPLFRRRQRVGPWGKRYRRSGFDAGDAGILLWTLGNALSDSSRHTGGGGFSGWGGGDSGGGWGGGWGGGGFSGGGGGWGGGGGASGSW